MIAPEHVAPVMATCEPVGTNWPVYLTFRNSGEDVKDWSLVIVVAFPGDARSDAGFVAELINAYRTGRLVLAPMPLFPEMP